MLYGKEVELFKGLFFIYLKGRGVSTMVQQIKPLLVVPASTMSASSTALIHCFSPQRTSGESGPGTQSRSPMLEAEIQLPESSAPPPRGGISKKLETDARGGVHMTLVTQREAQANIISKELSTFLGKILQLSELHALITLNTKTKTIILLLSS